MIILSVEAKGHGMVYRTRDDIVKSVANAILEKLQEWEVGSDLENQEVIDDLELFASWNWTSLLAPEDWRRRAIAHTGLISHCDEIMEELSKFRIDPWADALLAPVLFETSLRLMVFEDALELAKKQL